MNYQVRIEARPMRTNAAKMAKNVNPNEDWRTRACKSKIAGANSNMVAPRVKSQGNPVVCKAKRKCTESRSKSPAR